MAPGRQEIIALLIVAVIVGLAIWRRSRKRKSQLEKHHAGSDPKVAEEAEIHFYRRNKD